MASAAQQQPETTASQTDFPPLEERIPRGAYEIWLQRGGWGGSDLDDWLGAEQEILGSEPERVAE